MGSVTGMCVLYVYLEVCTHMCKTMKKEAINLKENKESYMGEFGEQKGRGKLSNYIIVSKMQEPIKKMTHRLRLL